MGAHAATKAATLAEAGDVDRMVLLSPGTFNNPDAMKANAFLIMASRDEKIIDQVRALYEKTPDPKRLELFEGTAHAQHLFGTGHAERLTDRIVSFLREEMESGPGAAGE